MPKKNSQELEYLHERRKSLGGYMPKRITKAKSIKTSANDVFQPQLDGTGEREASTTMAFIRMLTSLTRDKQIGKHIVPIVPDEARTFGMEGMFRQLGIYTSAGQKYIPHDLSLIHI